MPAGRATFLERPDSPGPGGLLASIAVSRTVHNRILATGGHRRVKRAYAFVLGDKFLHERNVSRYPPQPKNEKGEIHEHWSFFSYDRARRSLVLRQLHQEGFVNQYVAAPASVAGTIVFETEALENVPAGWKARETYQVLSADEFVETFELASGPGAYEVYSKARFKRVRRP
jgi:hypothetical protein